MDGESPTSPSGAIAFFDLDRTLLRCNSARLWFQWERSKGRLRLRHAVEAAIWGSLYKVGLMRAQTALGRAVATIKGESESELAEKTRLFFKEEIEAHIAPAGLAALEQHRVDGDAIVLLTSASPYLCACLEDRIQVDGVLCTRYEVEDDQFTGRLVFPICFGRGKVEHAEAWADERGLDLDRSTFYTDSVTDLPMLERVGRPVVVQPDVRLGRIARKRGWEILDWGAEPTDV
jgi:HAD superfamily hydrolase (TIGR01490 family)